MKLALKTAPSVEPISLTEVKKHLRLATTDAEAAAYTREDTQLTAWIETAREMAEAETGTRLITQSWYLYLDEWPDGDEIRLPYPPLQSATVKYRLEDDSGYDNTFSDVIVDTVGKPGRIVLKSDYSWPTDTLYDVNPIQIEYTCGYGAAGSDVPSKVRSAMFLKLTDLYEHRGETVIGASVGRLHDAAESLLRQCRDWTFPV